MAVMDVEVDIDSQPSILSARLKVRRAKTHLDALHEAVKVYARSKPYELIRYDDLEAGYCFAEFRVSAPGPDMALIVGDFISYLRSSLDHVAYQLGRLGTADLKKTSFPIVGVPNADGRSKFDRATKGLPEEGIDVIDALQPYHRGAAYEATKLWQLERLWNIDKHRRIPFKGIGLHVGIFAPPGTPILRMETYNSSIWRFPISVKDEVQLDPTIGVSVSFGDDSESIHVEIADLIDIYEFVDKDALPRFRGVFEHLKGVKKGDDLSLRTFASPPPVYCG